MPAYYHHPAEGQAVHIVSPDMARIVTIREGFYAFETITCPAVIKGFEHEAAMGEMYQITVSEWKWALDRLAISISSCTAQARPFLLPAT